MMVDLVVSNTSSLIGLERIGQLHLLQQLFGVVVVPPAVVREIGATTTLPKGIEQRDLTQTVGPRILSASLGVGESEAVSLALESHARVINLDDRPARRLAQVLHLPVIGTIGVLLAAKCQKLLPVLRPSLDALVQHDFRIGQQLYEQVLRDAGEAL
jgi:hypothetical protein